MDEAQRPRPPKRGMAGVGELLQKSLTTALQSQSGGDSAAPPLWLREFMKRDQENQTFMVNMCSAALMVLAGDRNAGLAVLQSARDSLTSPTQPTMGSAGAGGARGSGGSADAEDDVAPQPPERTGDSEDDA